MKSVTQDWIDIYNATSQPHYNFYINVNGDEYDIDGTRLKSIKLYSALYDGSGPQVGNTYSDHIEIELLDQEEEYKTSAWPRMAEVIVKARIVDSDGDELDEDLVIGHYFVDERDYNRNTKTLRVVCYDAMLKTDQTWYDKVSASDLPSSWPITSRAAANLVAEAIGFTIANPSALNDTSSGYPQRKFIGLDTERTARDVLDDVAAGNGGNWRVDPTDPTVLRFVPLKTEYLDPGALAIPGIAIAGITVVGDTTRTPASVASTDIIYLGRSAISLDVAPELDPVSSVTLTADNGAICYAGNDTGYNLTGHCNTATTENGGPADLCIIRMENYQYRPFTARGSYLDPRADVGDLVIVDGVCYQIIKADWTLGPALARCDISAPYEQEVEHEYQIRTRNEKNLAKVLQQTDELHTEIQQTEQSIMAYAERKTTVYTTTPAPPYVLGDLWFNQTTGELMECTHARETGSYTSSDWTKKDDYESVDYVEALHLRTNKAYGVTNTTKFRCLIKDDAGHSTTTNVVQLTVLTAPLAGPILLCQPVSQTVMEMGDSVSVTVHALGSGANTLSYQWWLKNRTGSTFNRSSNTTDTYTATLSNTTNGRQLYCVITDSGTGNSVTTDTVTISVDTSGNDIVIGSQPTGFRNYNASDFWFETVAYGSGISYQWQRSDDDGTTWTDAHLNGSKTGKMYGITATDSAPQKPAVEITQTSADVTDTWTKSVPYVESNGVTYFGIWNCNQIKYKNGAFAWTNPTIDGATGDIGSLETRVASAELKITPDAIVSTVTSSDEFGQEITSQISQSADTIRMQASQIIWQANNSSMDYTGKLTCSAARIGDFDVGYNQINTESRNYYLETCAAGVYDQASSSYKWFSYPWSAAQQMSRWVRFQLGGGTSANIGYGNTALQAFLLMTAKAGNAVKVALGVSPGDADGGSLNLDPYVYSDGIGQFKAITTYGNNIGNTTGVAMWAYGGNIKADQYGGTGGIVAASDEMRSPTYTTTSDLAKKDDVKYDYSKYEGLFRKLKPSDFKFKDGTSGRTHLGFVAQDVVAALDESGIDTKDFAPVVEYEELGTGEKTWGIRYQELISLNTHMIQKLMDRCDALEARCAELERQLAAKNEERR